MKAWVWVIIASVGFAVMLAAYASRERVDSDTPWSSGLIVISPEASAEKSGRAGAIPRDCDLLSSSDVAEMLLFATGDLVPDKALGVKGQVRVKLIELPLAMVGIGADWLAIGAVARSRAQRGPGRRQDRAERNVARRRSKRSRWSES